jgi:hypothetical protein
MHAGAYYEERMYIMGGFTSLHPPRLGADSWYRDDRMPSVSHTKTLRIDKNRKHPHGMNMIMTLSISYLCVFRIGHIQTHTALAILEAQLPLRLGRGRNRLRVPRLRPQAIQGAQAVDTRRLHYRRGYVRRLLLSIAIYIIFLIIEFCSHFARRLAQLAGGRPGKRPLHHVSKSRGPIWQQVR